MLKNGQVIQFLPTRNLYTTGIAILLLFCSANPLHAQADTTGQAEISRLMNQFKELKSAAIAGDAATVSQKSTAFIQTLNTIDYKILSEGNHHILLKDASIISETTIAQHQKQAVENLTRNMEILARSFNLKDSVQ